MDSLLKSESGVPASSMFEVYVSCHRHALSAVLSRDINSVLRYLVKLYASNTKPRCLSNKEHPFTIFMNELADLAVAAGKKLEFLFRACMYFSTNNPVTLTKAQLKPEAMSVIFGMLHHQLH